MTMKKAKKNRILKHGRPTKSAARKKKAEIYVDDKPEFGQRGSVVQEEIYA